MRSTFATLYCALGFASLGGASCPIDDKAALEKEARRFQGTWTFESSETGGTVIPPDQLKDLLVVFEGDRHTVKAGDQVIQVGTQKIDPSRSPRTIDVTMSEGPNKGAVMLGIYEFDGEVLKVCFDTQGKTRPTEFRSAPGSQCFVNVLRRVKE